MRSWLLVLAAGLAVAAAPQPAAAAAIETPVGSKNFSAPRSVPNYFSNETGSFTGGPHGAQPAAPTYAAPRVYPQRSHGYATASRRSHHGRGRVASRRHYHHPAHGRAAAHRHFVHAAGRRGGTRSHGRRAAVHHGSAHSHAGSTGGTKRLARAGR